MPQPKAIKAIVFDLDDTLYLERQYVQSGFRAVGEFLRAATKPQATKNRMPGDVYAVWMWRQFLSGRREAVFDALNEHFQLGLSRPGVKELVKVYREHTPDIAPLPDVRPLLKRLRRQGVRIGLLSDGYLPAQRLKWEALGLAEFFEEAALVFTEELGREFWKPCPRGFRSIRQALGVRHDECAYVADNPAKDFLAPNRLGWLSVQWLHRGQLHGRNPAPKGGTAQIIVRSAKEMLAVVAGATGFGKTRRQR